jgi:raffinose/stachyose/melibiose transport system permease protein
MRPKFRTMNGKDKTLFLLKYVYLILCVFVALFPIVWVLLSSFKTNGEILSNGISLPKSFSFTGYHDALAMAPIFKFFANSVIITVITTICNVLIFAMAGYVFAKCKFRGKKLAYFILSLSLVIPMTALLQPVYNIVNHLGLYDTKAGLILVNTALNMPMSLLILTGSFRSIPKAIEEAAVIDGAGFVRTFFQIMMPCAKGGLTSAAVLCFLDTWNEFTFSLILTSSEGVRTLPLSLSYFTSQFSFNYTALFAAVTIAVIPSIAVFAIFQEQVVSSLTAGAVKE